MATQTKTILALLFADNDNPGDAKIIEYVEACAEAIVSLATAIDDDESGERTRVASGPTFSNALLPCALCQLSGLERRASAPL